MSIEHSSPFLKTLSPFSAKHEKGRQIARMVCMLKVSSKYHWKNSHWLLGPIFTWSTRRPARIVLGQPQQSRGWSCTNLSISHTVLDLEHTHAIGPYITRLAVKDRPIKFQSSRAPVMAVPRAVSKFLNHSSGCWTRSVPVTRPSNWLPCPSRARWTALQAL
jgi:hypothetical protein